MSRRSGERKSQVTSGLYHIVIVALGCSGMRCLAYSGVPKAVMRAAE
jgi:hypothetical protein